LVDAIHLFCAATSVGCALLLFRAWFETRNRLMLWMALCFVGLVLNNLLMIANFIVSDGAGLIVLRQLSAITALGVLLYGLIWEAV
jgi:hypothetical protein